MKICLSHATALAWLMCLPNPRAGAGYRVRPIPLDEFGVPEPAAVERLRAAIAERTGISLAELPTLDLVVGDPGRRRACPGARVRTCVSSLPAGSVLRTDVAIDGIEVFVSAPELAFVQVAATGDAIAAIEAGMALCSEYRLDRAVVGGAVKREGGDAPLTSVARIAGYLGRAVGVTGAGPARRALAHVHDGSRSPRESHLAMILGLPLRLGGFGLPLDRLNPPVRIIVRSGAHGEGSDRPRYPDMRFRIRARRRDRRDAYFDYDGDSTHRTGARKAARDASRRNEFSTLRGVSCFSMTSMQAGDFREVERTAEMIRRALGMRRKPRVAGDPEAPGNRRAIERARSRQFGLWSRLIGIPNARRRGEP